jgi:hypothetical protein
MALFAITFIEDKFMQAFGNVGQAFTRVVSKTSNKGYWQGRIGESHKGIASPPTWYTVRIMVDKDPELKLGDFVRCTGQLKVDFYMSRETPPKPSGNLLILAFEAFKVERPSEMTSAKEVDRSVEIKKPSRVAEQLQPPPAAASQDTRRNLPVLQPVCEQFSGWSD